MDPSAPNTELEVPEMPALTAPHKTHTAPALASEAAREFALKLIAQRSTAGISPRMTGWVALMEHGYNIPARNCSMLIDSLKKQPYKPGSAPKPQVEEGFFWREGQYYRAQLNREGTRMYAKVWDGSGWGYAAGALSKLTEDMRLSAEEAKAFGDQFHRCIFCGQGLTDDRSITAGYGPTCADSHGLPWG